LQVHFNPSDITRDGNKKRVRKDAVPTTFCECPEPLSKRTKRKPLLDSSLNNKSSLDHCYGRPVVSTPAAVPAPADHSYFHKPQPASENACNIVIDKEHWRNFPHQKDCILWNKAPLKLSDIETTVSLPPQVRFINRNI